MFLAELKTTDFKPNEKYAFVISLGATEQHGPYLPLGADTYIQDKIIAEVNKRLPKIIFLPTLPITSSKEHKGFPGTIWIEKATLEQVLQDITNSLREYANKIVFL